MKWGEKKELRISRVVGNPTFFWKPETPKPEP